MRYRRPFTGLTVAAMTAAAIALLDAAPVAAALPAQCESANGVDVTCTFEGEFGRDASYALTIPDGVGSVHLHVVGTAGQASSTTPWTTGGVSAPGGRPAAVDADIATSGNEQLDVVFRDNGGYGRFAFDATGPYDAGSGSGGGSAAVQRSAAQGGALIAEAGGGGGGGLTEDASVRGSAGGAGGEPGSSGTTEGDAVAAASGGGAGALGGHGAGGAGATVDLGSAGARTFPAGAPGEDSRGGVGGSGEFPGGGGGGGTTTGGGGGAGGTGVAGRGFGAGGGGGGSTVPAGGTIAVSPDESSLVRITFSLDVRSGYDPTSLDFGTVTVGSTSARRAITLTNTGSSPLSVGSGSFADETQAFAVAADGCSRRILDPGTSCEVSLTFTPQARGSATATYTLPDNSTGSPHTTALTGTGLAPPAASVSPSRLTFGAREIGTESPSQAVTLTNTGEGDLVVGSVTVKVDASFVITADSCSHAVVAAQGSCAVSVAFRPVTTGRHWGSLKISHDAGTATEVALDGVGTPPADLKVLGVGLLYTGRDHLVSRAVSASGRLQKYPVGILNEDAVAHTYRIGLDSSGLPARAEVRNSLTNALLPVVDGSYVTATVQPGKTAVYSLQVTPSGVGQGTSVVRVTLQSDVGAPIESLTTETNTAAPANGTTGFELFARQGSQLFIGGPQDDQTTTGPALNVGGSATYTVRLENNSAARTQVGLRLTDVDGCTGSFTVSVTAAGKVRTVDAYAGAYLTPPLNPGSYQDVQVSIKRAAAGCPARRIRAQSLDAGAVVRTSYLLANAAYAEATD